jgi:ATP-dependent helicase/nuclease subunit B
MLAIAAETAADCSTNTRRLMQLPMLLLDVPIASKAELDLLATLRSSASEILATVPTADEPTLARLRDRLRFEIEDLDEGASAAVNGGNDRSGSPARLQRNLFNEETTLVVSLRDDQVLVFSAPGESQECVEIARRVLALARIGMIIYGSRQRCIGNLPNKPRIPSSRKNFLTWQRSARRSPIILKIV